MPSMGDAGSAGSRRTGLSPCWRIGSKADGLRESELIINAKAELEKMREQVQNIE